jgi:hypothetical protein
MDLLEGNMGCAQETLDMILKYLHREFIDPNYIKICENPETRFQLINQLDDMGCSPKCAPHRAFGI